MELVERRILHEEVHGGRTARLQREILRVPGVAGAPVLGIERTVLPGGPSRPPVLMIHGLAQNHLSWRLSRRSLPAALAERGHDVYNLCLRGHGWSRRFGAPVARSVDDYVVDATRAVGAMPDEVFLMGHSLGAAISVMTAPKVTLRGLIHVAGIYTFAQHSKILQAAARVTKHLDGRVPRGLAVNSRPIGRTMARGARAAELAWRVLPLRGWSEQSLEPDLLEERLIHGFDTVGSGIWLHMARWARGEPIDPQGHFGRLDLPLLVLTGEDDGLAHPQDGEACYVAAEGSRDRTLVAFSREQYGHAPGHLDIMLGTRAPDVVWPILFDWLEVRGTNG